MADKATLAVVTGSHPFDVPNFHKLFRALDGVDTYVQSMDDFATSPEEVRDGYDAVLFYHMLMPTPVDEGDWGSGRPAAAQQRLGETGQGVIVLHHAILAYPEWEVWTDMTGLADRAFDFHPEQQLTIDIANGDHPVTAGLSAWEMGDETYTMAEPVGENNLLLTTDHEKCMHSIAWTRQFNKARVFCFQSGHDNVTWADANYREVLRRGVLWSAGKL